MADSPPLAGGGIKTSEKRPGIPRPSGVVQRVMPGAKLSRQFRIAQFDRPLFDVETKLRIVDSSSMWPNNQLNATLS